MIELELLGANSDGTQLVFTDEGGTRYTVPIDNALKATIRRESIQLESMPKRGAGLSPRQIQELLRAGMEPEEISSEYNVDVVRINRFLSPVRAEQNYIISRALRGPVGGADDAPSLQDLCIDRLATRGVSAASFEWRAYRRGDHPWELQLLFVQDARENRATWEVTPMGRVVRAIDEEAHWLTETVSPAQAAPNVEPLPSRSHASTRPGESASGEDVEQILDTLTAARGKRMGVEIYEDEDSPIAPIFALNAPAQEDPPQFPDEDEEPEDEPATGKRTATSSGNSAGDDAAAEDTATSPREAHAQTGDSASKRANRPSPLPSRRERAKQRAQHAGEDEARSDSRSDDRGASLPGFEGIEQEGAKSADSERPPKRRRSSKRRSVPSWDEIVFGSK
ncbi:septation protein SepH [Gleimia hominis]|uniref:Septation protein SepH n=1 Tax=Gleimia hominis TaxID=595468 RepID=A0ABU3IBI1_9ACTO|nr:septation protein SepH [Gleimia hominis]MDT3767739.1 septation protein SepH [Gleimia hominis]